LHQSGKKASGQSGADHSSTDHPSTDHPANDHPCADLPATDMHTTDLPPGSQVMPDNTKITVTVYDETHFHEIEVKSVEECFAFKSGPSITWINIDCLHEMGILEKLGACYGFHPLVLEDILTDQRPKIEDYDDYIFIVLKMIYYGEDGDNMPG
jgi:hypothetical protein